MTFPEQPASLIPPHPPSPSAEPSRLSSIQHIVQLMLENRSFDHMLGFHYPNKTGPRGQPFEGLRGTEANNAADGNPVGVSDRSGQRIRHRQRHDELDTQPIAAREAERREVTPGPGSNCP